MGFNIDPSRVLGNMAAIKKRSMYAAEIVAQNGAAKLEAEAKRDAPWVDRTGLARQTIRGVSGWDGGKLLAGVTGNMDYSPYLELTREGRDAVLFPTVERNREELMAQFSKVVR